MPAYRGERNCEWCGDPATRMSHDGCYFCQHCAMLGDMYLNQKPKTAKAIAEAREDDDE